MNNPGENHDVRDFLDIVEEELPAAAGKLRCEGGSVPVAWDLREDGLKELLGDVPHTPIRAGIQETIRGFAQLREAGRLES